MKCVKNDQRGRHVQSNALYTHPSFHQIPWHPGICGVAGCGGVRHGIGIALAASAALFAAESFCTNSKQEGVAKIEPQSEVASASDGIGIGSQSRRSAVWGRNCGVSTKTPLVIFIFIHQLHRYDGLYHVVSMTQVV